VWVASVRRGWNNLQFLWYEKVVGYDASVQLELWRQVRDWLAAVGTACLAVARAAGNGVRDLFARGVVDQVALSIAIGVGSLGLVLEGLLVFRLIRQAVRARRIARGEPPAHVGQVRFMRRLLSLLAGRRLRLRPNQTLKAFAAEAVASGMPAGTMNDLVGLYYRIRWGRQAPRIEQLRDAEGQVESLRQSLRRGG
jgi:hypothetical protein